MGLRVKDRKLLEVFLVVLPAVAAVLTALPFSFILEFSGGSSYVSGFDMLLIGYGNWEPMVTGILSIVLALRGIWYVLRKNRQPFRGVTGMAFVACAFSLVSIFFKAATLYSLLISAALFGLIEVNGMLKKWNGEVKR